MDRVKVVLICTFLFLSLQVLAVKSPTIKARLNTNNSLVGRVVRLIVSVKLDAGNQASWQLCDSIFKESYQITLLDIGTRRSNSLIIHEIAFTCLTGRRLSIPALPVGIINGQNTQFVFTPILNVNFIGEKRPGKLDHIFLNKKIDWYHLLTAVIGVLLTLSFLMVVIKRTLLNQQKKPIVFSDALMSYVGALDEVEWALTQKLITTDLFFSRSAAIITDLTLFLNQSVYRDELAVNLPSLSFFKEELDKLKFKPKSEDGQSYADLMNSIKKQIQSYKVRNAING